MADSVQHDAPEHRQKAGKGLAFDPLPKPKSRRSHPQATTATATGLGAFGGNFGALPPDIADQDDLAAGFQKLMAELSQGADSSTTENLQSRNFTNTAHASRPAVFRFTKWQLATVLYMPTSLHVTGCAAVHQTTPG